MVKKLRDNYQTIGLSAMAAGAALLLSGEREGKIIVNIGLTVLVGGTGVELLIRGWKESDKSETIWGLIMLVFTFAVLARQ